MQIDIVPHIEKLLFDHETLIVPGFGGFTTTRSAANADFVGGTVTPPAKTLAFNENLTVDDGILVHELTHHYQVSNDEAREAIAEFVAGTRALLDQREIVTLPGIGRMYKNYAQKMQFLPDATNFNTESYGLPPLQFSPLARARETAETPAPAAAASGTSSPVSVSAVQQVSPPAEPVSVPAPATVVVTAPAVAAPAVSTPPPPAPLPVVAPPPSEPMVERSRRRSPMRSMAAFITALIVFALAVGLYLMKQKKNGREAVVETPALETPHSVIPNPAEVLSDAQKAAEAQNKAAEKHTIDVPPTEMDRNDDTADEVDEAAAKRAQAAENQKVKPKAAPPVKEKAAPNIHEKPTANSGEGGNRCVLVIGTYQNKSNASKLLEKLRANGWDTYYRVVKGHQVGVEFQYSTLREVQEKIQALEKLTGEHDIWIKKK